MWPLFKEISNLKRNDRTEACEIDDRASIEVDGDNGAARRLCDATGGGEEEEPEPKHHLIIECDGESRQPSRTITESSRCTLSNGWG